MYQTYKQWPPRTFPFIMNSLPKHCEDAAAEERENFTDVFGVNTLHVQRKNALTFKHPEVVNRNRTYFSGLDARWITFANNLSYICTPAN